MERKGVEFAIAFLFSFAILLCHCCPPGYYGNSPQCTPCPADTYKDSTGDADKCNPCPVLSQHTLTGSTTIKDCKCPKGYYGVSQPGEDCVSCPKNSYKDFDGYAAACTSCPSNSGHSLRGRSTVRDCKCFTGYEGRPHDGQACFIRSCEPLWAPVNGAIVGSCNHLYLSVCVIRCNEGYEAVGSAERQCIVTPNDVMEWTGTPVQCESIRCPVLYIEYAAPPFGSCTNFDLVYQTRCSFSCSLGYRLKGSKERQCQLDKTWSGVSTVCEKIQCAPLPSVPYARYEPAECTTHPMDVFTMCSLICHGGFVFDYQSFQGVEGYTCEVNGNWSSSVRQCHDIQPPRLTCPFQIKTNTPSDSATADVLWSIAVSDNSFVELDSRATVKLNSSYVSPHKFTIGVHDVKVEAIDHAGNKETCVFQVIVTDNEPPTCSFCPADIELLELTTSETRVNWQRPICSDNSGILPNINSNRQSGDLFGVPGAYEIQYSVQDQSANTYKNCSFRILLKKKTCPLHPAPKNGALACHFKGSDPACVPMCKKGYKFESEPALVYWCSAGQWHQFSFAPQSSLSWPDCVDTGNPSFVSPHPFENLFFDGDAENPNEAIQTNYIRHMKSGYVPHFFCYADCTESSVTVDLGEQV